MRCRYCREDAVTVKDGNAVCPKHFNLVYPWESVEKICRWCGEAYKDANVHQETHDYGGK